MNDNIVTGGMFGLEGGLVNTFVMLFAMVIIFMIYRENGENKEITRGE